jgi:hypothetical protein
MMDFWTASSVKCEYPVTTQAAWGAVYATSRLKPMDAELILEPRIFRVVLG